MPEIYWLRSCLRYAVDKFHAGAPCLAKLAAECDVTELQQSLASAMYAATRIAGKGERNA